MPALEPPTRFVGRDADVARIDGIFASGDRLVTLWGPPGIGKSRVARRFAARHADGGGDTILCVCAEANSADELAAALAAALRVSLGADRDEDARAAHLGRALAGRHAPLLVLDGVEQVVDPAASIVAALLAHAPQARLLSTSRERLRVDGEVGCEIAPLPVSVAAELFADRARACRPEFELDDGTRSRVEAIVQQLEGLPLAIELAAARLDVLGLDGLNQRLDATLDVLRSKRRGASARQATMRGAIEWSWALLDASERAALAQSSVFAGSFALDAAEAVLDLSGANVLDTLESLRDKSLLRVERGGENVRYAHFSAIRAFGAEKLGEASDEVRRRHGAHVVAVGGGRAAAARFGDVKALRRIGADHANIHAVLERALVAGDATTAATAVTILEPLLATTGPLSALVAPLNRVIEDADGIEDAGLVASIWRARGNALRLQGKLGEAQSDLQQARAVAPRDLEGAVIADLGVLHHQRRELDDAARAYADAKVVLHEVGDRHGEARVLGNEGALAHDTRRFDEALEVYRAAIAIFSDVGDRRLEGIFLTNLGVLEHELEERDDARVHFEAALERLEAAGDERFCAITLGNLGLLDHAEGDLDRARQRHEAALTRLRRMGELRSVALGLGRLAAVLAPLGEVEDARRQIDEAERILERVGDPVALAAVQLCRGFLAVAAANDARLSGDEATAAERRADVRSMIDEAREGAPSLVAQSDDARMMIRFLESALGESDPSENALIVGAEAGWFRPPAGTWHDLRRKKTLRRVLHRLIEERVANPGGGLPVGDLLQAGWPGEKMSPDAGANRVYVVLNKLRKLGLDGSLVRADDGYRIDPSVVVTKTDAEYSTLTGCD